MNAILKSALVGGLGIVGPLLLNAASAPTGGLAAYLAANPAVGTLYALGLYTLHNLLSQHAPPPVHPTPTQTLVSAVVAEAVAPVVAKL